MPGAAAQDPSTETIDATGNIEGRDAQYGVSSGAMLALEAAAAGLSIGRLGVYDVPYDAAPGAAERFQEYRERLGAALAEGRRGDAVELFMRLAGSSDEDIAGARRSPHWPGLETLAPTLAYDATLYGPPPVGRRGPAERGARGAQGAGTRGRPQGGRRSARPVPRRSAAILVAA